MKKNKFKKIRPKGIINRCASELTGMMTMIEIHSDYEMIICGCVGIIDYSSSYAIADTISGKVTVEGICLQLDYFQGDMLTVCGKINSITFGEKL